MSDQFYSSIANQYQHIFPFNPEQINFLRSAIQFNGAKILDVGCATGELAFALTHFGLPVWAIDYDAQMIELANQSKAENSLFPVFEMLDMRLIAEHFPESFFDTIICFGNTMVHLTSEADLLKFLQGANKILVSEGILCIQILNYDHILDHQIVSLPTIENEHVKFERNYQFHEGSDLIDFNTRVTIKSTRQEIINSVQLIALRRNKLQELIIEAGFEILGFFGNFDGTPLTESGLPLIVTCRKPIKIQFEWNSQNP